MKKLNKVLSVLLTLAVVCSMFVSAAPVSADAVATAEAPKIQQWVKCDTPATDTYVVSGEGLQILGVDELLYNADESAIFAVVCLAYETAAESTTVVLAESCTAILKSTNAGRSWTLSTIADRNAYIPGFNPLVWVVASPDDPDTLVYTDGYNVFITRDGGVTWILQRNVFTALHGTEGYEEVSMITAIDYIKDGDTEYVFIGTANGNVANLKIKEGNGQWYDTQLAADYVYQVLAIKENFHSDFGIMAIVAESTTALGDNVVITHTFHQEAWGETADDIIVASATDVIAAMIWLPEDYADVKEAYVGLYLDDAATGTTLYKVGAEVEPYPFENSAYYNICNITGYGTADDPYLVLGAVIGGSEDNASATATVLHSVNGADEFAQATTDPQGFAWCYVLLLSDYEANGKAIAGTWYNTVADEINFEPCGLYFSSDYCDNFRKISLMGNVFGAIKDVAGDLYVLAGEAPKLTLWRFLGEYWEIVNQIPVVNDAELVRLNVAKDGSLWYAELGTTDLYVSVDQGISFKKFSKEYINKYNDAGVITAWLPLDKASYLVCTEAGYVITWTGSEWTKYTSAYGTIIDLYAADDAIYAVAATDVGTTTVLSTTDAGVNWEAGLTGNLASDTAFTVVAYSDEVKVAFADDIVADAYGAGLATEGTGVVYVLNDGIVERLRGNATSTELTYYPEAVDNLAPAFITKLWLTKEGTNNKVWAIANDGIYYYIDALNVPGTGLEGSFKKVADNNYTITLKWDGMDNAGAYLVGWSTSKASDIATIEKAAALSTSDVTTKTTIDITGIAANKTVYANVWVLASGVAASSTIWDECFSFAYEPVAFQITTPISAPFIVTPNDGDTKVQFNGTQIKWSVNEAWMDNNYSYANGNPAATGYEVQIIAFNAGDDYNKLIETAPIVAISGYKNTAYAPKLNPSTSYAVRVRGVTKGADGEWSKVYTFTTADKIEAGQAASQPITVTSQVVTFTQATYTLTNTVVDSKYELTYTQPNVTLTVPQGQQGDIEVVLPEQSTPVYVWVIIAIGAILCIAVIVLIVRTRRVV